MTQDNSILETPVQVCVTKMDCGLVVLIPEDMLASAGFKEGDTVNLYVRSGRIEVTDSSKRRYDIEKMIAQISDENLPDPISTGPPVGREIW